MTPTIRPYQPGDEIGICEAHMRSIREICAKDYPPEAIESWSNRYPERYVKSIKENNEKFHVIDDNGKVGGFSGWYGESIMGFYMHPDYAGKGLAKKLFQITEKDYLHTSGHKVCNIESTITARPFYERMGFDTVKAAKHTFHSGVIIDTWKMVKHYV